MQEQLKDLSTENEMDPGVQAGVGRNLTENKINRKILTLQMLIHLSVNYFNLLASYTVKPAGVNIVVCLVDSYVTLLHT